MRYLNDCTLSTRSNYFAALPPYACAATGRVWPVEDRITGRKLGPRLSNDVLHVNQVVLRSGRGRISVDYTMTVGSMARM